MHIGRGDPGVARSKSRCLAIGRRLHTLGKSLLPTSDSLLARDVPSDARCKKGLVRSSQKDVLENGSGLLDLDSLVDIVDPLYDLCLVEEGAIRKIPYCSFVGERIGSILNDPRHENIGLPLINYWSVVDSRGWLQVVKIRRAHRARIIAMSGRREGGSIGLVSRTRGRSSQAGILQSYSDCAKVLHHTGEGVAQDAIRQRMLTRTDDAFRINAESFLDILYRFQRVFTPGVRNGKAKGRRRLNHELGISDLMKSVHKMRKVLMRQERLQFKMGLVALFERTHERLMRAQIGSGRKDAAHRARSELRDGAVECHRIVNGGSINHVQLKEFGDGCGRGGMAWCTLGWHEERGLRFCRGKQ